MDKLTFLDTSFLRMESNRQPWHVAGLMVFKRPADAPNNYLRKLAKNCGRLNEVWPIFQKKLSDPESLSDAMWVPEESYEPGRHVLHYALPQPGRMEDLLEIVSRAHEQPLSRARPLWEMHLIEGLPGDRFALYCKVHHALVDGVGALRMVQSLLSESPKQRLDMRRFKPQAAAQHEQHSIWRDLSDKTSALMQQYNAVPQLSQLIANMGMDAVRGKKEAMRLPFTAPRTLFNTVVDSRRRIVTCDLPFKSVQGMARRVDGTINDVLLAICGGALRRYLLEQDALPGESLLAGMPVSVKGQGQEAGNQISFVLCPFFSDEKNDLRRLRRIIRTTRRIKKDLARMTPTASQDFANILMMPTMLLSLSGNSTLTRPFVNALVSNVPGPAGPRYLEGAELEGLYPLSVITDAMAINLTVVSCDTKLCFAITSCPTEQPGIENIGKYLKQSFKELRTAVQGI